MRELLLHEENGLRRWLLVLDSGDEGFGEIVGFARDRGIRAASLTAIGAASSATIGWFDPDLRQYRWRTYDEQMELASLIGDVSDDDGEPLLHAHVVLGRRDNSALAGHLKDLRVHPTMEVTLVESPAHLVREKDAASGAELLSVQDSTA